MALTDGEIRERLEPEVNGIPISIATEISLAISMKRIADALSYQSSVPENLYDLIREIRSK